MRVRDKEVAFVLLVAGCGFVYAPCAFWIRGCTRLCVFLIKGIY
jgi:hypothetical protein